MSVWFLGDEECFSRQTFCIHHSSFLLPTKYTIYSWNLYIIIAFDRFYGEFSCKIQKQKLWNYNFWILFRFLKSSLSYIIVAKSCSFELRLHNISKELKQTRKLPAWKMINFEFYDKFLYSAYAFIGSNLYTFSHWILNVFFRINAWNELFIYILRLNAWCWLFIYYSILHINVSNMKHCYWSCLTVQKLEHYNESVCRLLNKNITPSNCPILLPNQLRSIHDL